LDKPEEYFTSGIDLSNQDIEVAIERRNKARKEKDFELSDKIRDDLLENGIILEDKGTKTIWKKS
jgi:cysteinyl-tRNA synthetase